MEGIITSHSLFIGTCSGLVKLCIPLLLYSIPYNTHAYADIVFDPIVIEPSMSFATVLLSNAVVNDNISESIEVYSITVKSVEFGNGRRGNEPIIVAETISVSVIDDDCEYNSDDYSP